MKNGKMKMMVDGSVFCFKEEEKTQHTFSCWTHISSSNDDGLPWIAYTRWNNWCGKCRTSYSSREKERECAELTEKMLQIIFK